MEKKYKELNANAKLSPQAVLQQLIQNAQNRAKNNSQTNCNTGFKIFIKPNEIKPKQ